MKTEKLHKSEIIEIDDIIRQVMTIPPARKAALRLNTLGFTSHSLWLFQKTSTGKRMDDAWTCNVYTELKNMELK